MAEPPESLNIDDSYKTDEKSSPSLIPSRLTISLYLIALSESTLQASTSDSQHLECRQHIIPRHLIGPTISERTLQASTSDPQCFVCRQQIIPRHPIGSDYERVSSQSDIKAEPPEPLNIDDSSKFEEESLPNIINSIFTISKELKSSNEAFTERMLHPMEETRSQPYKSDITPEPPKPLNIDDSSKSEEASSLRRTIPTSFETPQASTSEFRHLEFSQEDVVELDHERLSSKSDIMAELTEPLNIEDSSKSDEESSPSSKSGQLEFSQHTNDSASSSPAIMPSDDQAETYSRDSQSRQKKAFCKFTIECISFIIFFILSLILYPYLRLHIYQNDMRNITITFPTAAIEIEKGILGQDQIVQVLTEYLQRDTPLLKVVALIGDTSVEKSYTMDLIKKKFRRRSDNGFSSLDPNFVVLENLRAEHSADVINYVKTFQEA